MNGRCRQCGAPVPDAGDGQESLCEACKREIPAPPAEWVLAASIGGAVALSLVALIAWRLSDASLLPTVDSLGGPDPVESAVPLPPPPPAPEPSASQDDNDEGFAVDDILIGADDEPEGSASASAEGASASASGPSVVVRGGSSK